MIGLIRTMSLAAMFVWGMASLAVAESWVLEPANSKLAFGSIKKNKIGEVHHFERISGSVSDNGAVSIEIDLSSVQTNIDIRNDRMREIVFANAQTATLTGQIDLAGLKSLPLGGSGVIETPMTLSLGNLSIEIEAELFVLRLAEKRVLVTTDSMIFLGTEEAGVDDAITSLMGIAQLSGITRTAPVTGRFVFTADNVATTTKEEPAQTASVSGDVKAGKRVFKKCKACHKLKAGKNGVGPSLAGVLGRPAGQVEGFKYSKVMAGSDVVWTPEAVAEFLKKPKKFMPGTKMVFAGLKKQKDIDNLLAFLTANAQ